MNIKTGKLYGSLADALASGEDREKLREIPTALEQEAKKELAGRTSVTVDLKRKTPLARFAAGQRVHPKRNMRKVRRKIAAASKKRNR